MTVSDNKSNNLITNNIQEVYSVNGEYIGIGNIPNNFNININNGPVAIYDVGTYIELQRRSLVGDNIDIHHVPAGDFMINNFPEYVYKNGNCIALTKEQHLQFHKEFGYRSNMDLTLNQTLARTVRQLRTIGVPNDINRQIIDNVVLSYQSEFNNSTVTRSQMRQNVFNIEYHFDGINSYSLEGPVSFTTPYDRIEQQTNHGHNHSTVRAVGRAAFLDGVQHLTIGLREDPSHVFTSDGLSEIALHTATSVPTHYLVHRGTSLGIMAAEAAGAEITVPIATIYASAEYSMCLDSFRPELRSHGNHHTNIERVMAYCLNDATLSTVGALSFSADVAASVTRGLQERPEMHHYNRSNMSFLESAYDRGLYATYLTMAAPGAGINMASGAVSSVVGNTYNSLLGSNRSSNIDTFDANTNIEGTNTPNHESSSQCLMPSIDNFRDSSNICVWQRRNHAQMQDNTSANNSERSNHSSGVENNVSIEDQVIGNSENRNIQSENRNIQSENLNGQSHNQTNSETPIVDSEHNKKLNVNKNINKSKESVEINLNDEKGIKTLGEAFTQLFNKLSEMKKEAIERNPELHRINMYLNEVNSIFGKCIIFKNWNNLSSNQKNILISSTLVGTAVRFKYICERFDISSSKSAGIGFICNIIESGKIKLDKIAGSFVEFKSGYPTGGLVKLVHSLTHKCNFKKALNNSIQTIAEDFMCYFCPEAAFLRSIITAVELGKELITRRKEVTIGSFKALCSTRLSIHGFNVGQKCTIDFPTLGIHVTARCKHSDQAQAQAKIKFIKLAKERCYTYYGLPYDILDPSGVGDPAPEKKKDEEEKDNQDKKNKEKVPIYEDLLKSRRLDDLFNHFKDINNMSEKDRAIFDHGCNEAKEVKEERIRNQILEIENSFFQDNQHLNPVDFVKKYLHENKFSNATQCLKSLYHLAFKTGHYKCDKLVLSTAFTNCLKYIGVNVDEFLQYVNHMNEDYDYEGKKTETEDKDKLNEKIKVHLKNKKNDHDKTTKYILDNLDKFDESAKKQILKDLDENINILSKENNSDNSHKSKANNRHKHHKHNKNHNKHKQNNKLHPRIKDHKKEPSNKDDDDSTPVDKDDDDSKPVDKDDDDSTPIDKDDDDSKPVHKDDDNSKPAKKRHIHFKHFGKSIKKASKKVGNGFVKVGKKVGNGVKKVGKKVGNEIKKVAKSIKKRIQFKHKHKKGHKPVIKPKPKKKTLEEEIKSRIEKENEEYSRLLQRMAEQRSSQTEGRAFEKNQEEEIKKGLDQKDVDPMILIVGFLEYLGIDPHYVFSDGTIAKIHSKSAERGAYSRENIIFWLNKEIIKSHFSVGNIIRTASGSGVGVVASTIAYIDLEAPGMFRSPGRFLVSKTRQFISNTSRTYVANFISEISFGTFTVLPIAKKYSSQILRLIKVNMSMGSSFLVNGLVKMISGEVNRKPWYETIYDLVENFIQNQGKLIHDCLYENFEYFKLISDKAVSYGTFVLDFISSKYGETWLYKTIVPKLMYMFAFVNPGNALIYTTALILGSRLAKSVIFALAGYGKDILSFVGKNASSAIAAVSTFLFGSSLASGSGSGSGSSNGGNDNDNGNAELLERSLNEERTRQQNSSLLRTYNRITSMIRNNVNIGFRYMNLYWATEKILLDRRLLPKKLIFHVDRKYRPLTYEEREDLNRRLPNIKWNHTYLDRFHGCKDMFPKTTISENKIKLASDKKEFKSDKIERERSTIKTSKNKIEQAPNKIEFKKDKIEIKRSTVSFPRSSTTFSRDKIQFYSGSDKISQNKKPKEPSKKPKEPSKKPEHLSKQVSNDSKDVNRNGSKDEKIPQASIYHKIPSIKEMDRSPSPVDAGLAEFINSRLADKLNEIHVAQPVTSFESHFRNYIQVNNLTVPVQ